MNEGYVVKLIYDDAVIKPRWARWVTAGSERGLSSRENATVFPDRRSAETEAELWKR